MTLDYELQMAQLEVKLLRAQFSSHFLFNHLNAINYCILSDDQKAASSYLTQFARLLRRLAADSQRDFVRLSDEVETIRLYIEIESLRYGKPIQFLTLLEPGIDPTQVWVPSLILHTYVENAVWGVSQLQTEEGTITLKLGVDSARYHLRLEDNGRKPSGRTLVRLKPQHNAGVDLTMERLRLLNGQFGTDLRVTLDDAESPGEQLGSVPARQHVYRVGSTVDLSFRPFVL